MALHLNPCGFSYGEHRPKRLNSSESSYKKRPLTRRRAAFGTSRKGCALVHEFQRPGIGDRAENLEKRVAIIGHSLTAGDVEVL